MGSHKVIFSIASLNVGNDVEVVADLKNMCDELETSKFRLLVIGDTRDQISSVITKKLQLTDRFQMLCRGQQLRDFIHEYRTGSETLALIGVEDRDLDIAASNRLLFLSARWVHCDVKVAKYGIPAHSPRKLTGILKNINQQTEWFYRCDLAGPIPTTVFALCSANHYGGLWHGSDEVGASNEFRKLLKDGDGDLAMKTALKCHLLAAMHHTPEFKEVQDWIVTPSSSRRLNDTLVELKEHLRSLTNSGKREPVLVRGEQVNPSSKCYSEDRQSTEFIQRHFYTVHVNPHCTIKGRLDDRVVCILDDYINYGNTLETMRNLLVSCGVRKILIVALAKYRNVNEIEHKHQNYRMIDNVYTPGGHEIEYKQQNYQIQGDIYRLGGYTATHISNTLLEARFNDTYKRDKNELRKIAKFLK
ncbi:uncharacterized protein LOC100372355 [Saccoglossus kowalevskii]|uniref:Uncharacterized protein LOC100372355 n=1 Tax=Saccoglossus kowalevskii TaxID=10224 RepID=A0ABM0GJS7_SACKO|nr:PREDICTED: uncharacterized protein LOC100372355 [Saccoglossus kowalevskii]